MGNAAWWVTIREAAVAHIAASRTGERTLCGTRINEPAHWWHGVDTLACATCTRMRDKGIKACSTTN